MKQVKIESNLRAFLVREGALERFERLADRNGLNTSIAGAFSWPVEEFGLWSGLHKKFSEFKKRNK